MSELNSNVGYQDIIQKEHKEHIAQVLLLYYCSRTNTIKRMKVQSEIIILRLLQTVTKLKI